MKLSKKSILIAMMLITALRGFSQDKEEYLPDGTQGEMLENVKKDTVPHKWQDKRWRLFPGRVTSLKVGGGFLYDFVTYQPDQISEQQMDSAGNVLEPTFAVRDMRIVMSGKLTTKRNITWKLGLMYNGPTDEWMVRESGIMIGVPELWGSFFVGRTKEGFSMNKVMNGYAGWTHERQMALDVIPILADGIKWLGFMPKQKLFWNLGVFTNWLSKDQTFSTYRWQGAARVGWLPIYSEPDQTVLHVAVSYRYGEPEDGQIKVRSRPESNPAPFFIDAGTIQSDYSNHIGAEVYYSKGPWMFGSEVYRHHFNSLTSENPVFTGGEIVATYILTGESRPYYTATAIYGFVPVKRSVFKGGPGAWEAVVRVSSLDLSNALVEGGKLWRITPMVNWYLSKEVRLEFAYGYGALDRFNLQGATHFFQTRLQLTLL